MADTDFERLVVSLSADLKSYENGMRKAVGVTNARAREIENRYRQMSASISDAVSAPLAGIGAALSVREITRYADAWTQAGNLIASAGQAAGVQVRSLENLRKGADDARTSIETYASLYASLIRSASGVAQSEEEVAQATNLVAKAMKAGGAGIQEQQAAIQQLGQALGSGVLQGDELRSLRENAPIIAQAIADEFGVAIGKLKDLGSEGKLTSDRVFQAIINAQPQIEAQFAKTNQTIADGMTKLGNSLTEYVGKAAQASGLTSAINQVLSALAGNMDAVGAAAAAAASILLSAYVPAMARAATAGAVMLATNPFLALAAAIGTAAFALAAYGDEIQPVQGEMATLQDYASSAWDKIASSATAAAGGVSTAFLDAINWITNAMSGVTVAWADVGEFVQGTLNRFIGIFVVLAEVVQANFTVLPNVIAAAVVGAMNAMIATVEAAINNVVSMINTLNSAVNWASNKVGLGDVLTELPRANLGRIENSYYEAAKSAGTAAADAMSEAMSRDYLGDAAKGLRDQANLTAFKNRISAAIDSANPTSTEGYGGNLILPDTPGTGGGGSKSKGRKARKNELEKEIEQVTKRTASLVAETQAQAALNPLLDDYGYAVERATALQDLLTAAQEAGIKVTPELQARMEGLATAYADATVAAAQLDESQDKIRQRAEEIRGLSESTTRGLVQDLLEGKSAADAFASALGKIGDKLLDMAFSDAFSAKGGLFGGGGKGGLLGGSIIPGILHSGGVAGRDGYGHGRSVSPSTFAGARRYHTGGIAGLRPGEVPAILKKGELVLPGLPKNSSASGGTVVQQTIQVDGATGNSEIMQMVAAGVAQGNAQMRREVPGIVMNHQRRNA